MLARTGTTANLSRLSRSPQELTQDEFCLHVPPRERRYSKDTEGTERLGFPQTLILGERKGARGLLEPNLVSREEIPPSP